MALKIVLARTGWLVSLLTGNRFVIQVCQLKKLILAIAEAEFFEPHAAAIYALLPLHVEVRQIQISMRMAHSNNNLSDKLLFVVSVAQSGSVIG